LWFSEQSLELIRVDPVEGVASLLWQEAIDRKSLAHYLLRGDTLHNILHNPIDHVLLLESLLCVDELYLVVESLLDGIVNLSNALTIPEISQPINL